MNRICCHGRRAVDGGGLVQLARDVLQTREVQHEVEADRPPDGGDRDSDHGQVGRTEHRVRVIGAEQGLEGVPQAGGRGVDEVPDQCDRRRGQDERDEEGEPEEPLTPAHSVRQHREDEGQDHQRRHGVDRELDGVPQRFPEIVAAEHLGVVGESHEVAEARRDQRGVEHARDEHVDHRPDQEQHEEDRERGDEQPAAGRPPCAFPVAGRAS